MNEQSNSTLEKTLFPHGTDIKNSDFLNLLWEEYKLFVATSERLVERRQKMNAFFLSFRQCPPRIRYRLGHQRHNRLGDRGNCRRFDLGFRSCDVYSLEEVGSVVRSTKHR